MKKTTLILFAFALILGVSSCKEKDTPKLGEAPTAADAAFTFKPSAANANVIEFAASVSGFTYKWNFGNGAIGEGAAAEGTYPNKGTYTVTLTVLNSGGSAQATQEIVIAEDDASLLKNPKFTLLTGGVAGGGSKTWVIDSTRAGHFGVGKVDGLWPEHYSAAPGDKANSGLYSDKYTFKLSGFKFDQITGGSVFVNNDQMAGFPGAYANSDDATAPYADQLGETWTLTEGADGDTSITISGKAFIGFYTGVRKYKILSLTENELYIKYTDTKDAALSWFVRLVPENYPIAGAPVNNSTLSLPINFETGNLSQWETFGNTAMAIIDNPHKGGINTSNKVLESIHGNETWAGQFVNLKDKLNFTSGKPTITFKIWAPATGTFKVKLENFYKTTENIEKDVEVTTKDTWVEVSVNLSDAEIGKYERLVLFPGWNVADAGTFYLDDISQK